MTTISLHATAVRIGATGLLLVGPSGAGKSSLALALMATARRMGLPSFLVSDDLVLVEMRDGAIIARGPGTMAGRIELRGSGIGTVASVAESELHLAIEPVVVTAANRIPEDGRRYPLSAALSLPLVSLDRQAPDPFAVLEALIPGFPG